MRLIPFFLILLNLALPLQAAESLAPVFGRPAAPPLVLKDMDGNVHRLSDYRGHPVIVNFWATWCPPCRAELPSMNRAWQALQKDGVVMLAVNVGEDEDTIFAFNADYPIDFPILLDRDSKAIDTWSVLGLPTTFVVDAQGRLAYRAVGGRRWDSDRLLYMVRALIPPAGR